MKTVHRTNRMCHEDTRDNRSAKWNLPLNCTFLQDTECSLWPQQRRNSSQVGKWCTKTVHRTDCMYHEDNRCSFRMKWHRSQDCMFPLGRQLMKLIQHHHNRNRANKWCMKNTLCMNCMYQQDMRDKPPMRLRLRWDCRFRLDN
jgi:hypothetical protein